MSNDYDHVARAQEGLSLAPPCSDFAPDPYDDPNVCTTCFYHRIDHLTTPEMLATSGVGKGLLSALAIYAALAVVIFIIHMARRGFYA